MQCDHLWFGTFGHRRSSSVAAYRTAASSDISNPKRFITTADATCQDWVNRQDKFAADVADWDQIAATIPASEWTPEQRAVNVAAYPVMSAYADDLEKVGRASGNPIVEDFAAASAIYLRAYVAVGTNYVKADGWLANMPLRLVSFVSTACAAAGTK